MLGYDSVAYARSRLIETLIRYKNKPVWVMNVGGTDANIKVALKDVESGRLIEEAVNLSDCDLDPVPLGYANSGGYAHYIMRAPMRRDWRQGLRQLNLVDSKGAQMRSVHWNSVSKTILGIYPSFLDCLKTISSDRDGQVHSVAYTRDFAVRRGLIQYKGQFDIGVVNMDNGNTILKDNMSWVREAFDESMENAA